MKHKQNLIVLIGPTGVGKTELSLSIAENFNTEIISADSRQLYRQLQIGTAAPTPLQLSRVKHHLVGTLELTDYYSAAKYEEEVIKLLEELFQKKDIYVLTGGSMMYIDAVCKGIDDIPTYLTDIRMKVWSNLFLNSNYSIPRTTIMLILKTQKE